MLLYYISPLFIIKSLGLTGILAVCFIENFIPFGGILPWDSLLFVIGLAMSQDKIIPLWVIPVMILLRASGMIGSIAWYYLGVWLRNKIDHSKKQRRYKPSMMEATSKYFDKHGRYAIIFSKFTPYVRSVVPIIAGIIEYPIRQYIISTAIGLWSWIWLFVWGGYLLTQSFPRIQEYVGIISFGILVLALMPALWQLVHWLYTKHKKNR